MSKELFYKINMMVVIGSLLASILFLGLFVYAKNYDTRIPTKICETEGFTDAEVSRIPFTPIICSRLLINKETAQIKYEEKRISWTQTLNGGKE